MTLRRTFGLSRRTKGSGCNRDTLLNRIAAVKRFDINKTREFHFDVLIALTARRIGAHLITCNVDDFTAIRETLNFNLVCW
jgi:predicted nucleic acid-binding protein